MPIKENVHEHADEIKPILGKRPRPPSDNDIDFDDEDIHEEIDKIQKHAKLAEQENKTFVQDSTLNSTFINTSKVIENE